MKINSDGCALCDSTWGNYWKEIENQKLFFCCNVCSNLFENLLMEIKKKLDIDKIDEIQLKGNSKSRKITVKHNSTSYIGEVSFRFGKITNFDLKKEDR